jgi:peptide/nickel transport system permease protein
VILTLNFIGAVLTLAGTLLSDVLYAVVDPRIRVE